MGQHIPPESLSDVGSAGLAARTADRIRYQQPLQQWLDEDDQLEESGLIDRILQQIESEYADSRLHSRQQILTCDWSRSRSCCNCLTSAGKSTWHPWISCAKAFIYERMRKSSQSEFKRESFELFQSLLYNIKYDVIRTLSRMQLENPEELAAATQAACRGGTANAVSACAAK